MTVVCCGQWATQPDSAQSTSPSCSIAQHWVFSWTMALPLLPTAHKHHTNVACRHMPLLQASYTRHTQSIKVRHKREPCHFMHFMHTAHPT